MKKTVVLFAILFLAAGFVSALTLSDSTFVVGAGYDFFRGGGKALSDSSEFNVGLKSPSLYGCYDVKVGNKMFSRVEYCLYVMTRSFDFGGQVPGEHAVLKPSKHNKRVGGFVSLDIGKKGPVGLISYIRTDSVRISKEAQAAALMEPYVQDSHFAFLEVMG